MALESLTLQERRARSAIVIEVPEVVGLIDNYRKHYTADGASVPPHITLLLPFFAPIEVTSVTRQRIGRVVSSFPSFDFMVTDIARFPTGVMYLTPQPVEPFIDLIDRLRQAFIEISPYWDQFAGVVPHVTVADLTFADSSNPLDDIKSRLSARLPVQCAARETVLLQRVRPAPAPWDEQGRFPLASP